MGVMQRCAGLVAGGAVVAHACGIPRTATINCWDPETALTPTPASFHCHECTRLLLSIVHGGCDRCPGTCEVPSFQAEMAGQRWLHSRVAQYVDPFVLLCYASIVGVEWLPCPPGVDLPMSPSRWNWACHEISLLDAMLQCHAVPC